MVIRKGAAAVKKFGKKIKKIILKSLDKRNAPAMMFCVLRSAFCVPTLSNRPGHNRCPAKAKFILASRSAFSRRFPEFSRYIASGFISAFRWIFSAWGEISG
jgi:hypothetical protein